MKLTDALINILIKRGVFGDIRNFSTEFEIPNDNPNINPTRIIVKAEHIELKIDKGV